MIPAIGYMIGFYIITRMLTILAPKDKTERPMVVVMATITVLVVVFCLIAITVSEFRVSDIQRSF